MSTRPGTATEAVEPRPGAGGPPTIADVARLAGVSRQTVSRVINGKGEITEATRGRVQAVIDQIGFRPNALATSLAGGRSRTIGLIVTNPASEIPTNPFFMSVIYGASVAAQEHGHGLTIKYMPAEAVVARRHELFARGQVDGIVILRAHRSFADAFSVPEEHRPPVVLIGDFPDGSACPYLDIDNRSGCEQLAGHLLRHGLRRIATVCHSPAGHTTVDSRVRWFDEALRSAGVEVASVPPVWTDSTLADAHAKARALLEGPDRPDAVFATNDWAAMAVLRAARDAGLRVPADVAVVGFDDLPLAAYLEPPLTTVTFSGFDLGHEALTRMLSQLELGTPIASGHLPARLVVRMSCGCEDAVMADHDSEQILDRHWGPPSLAPASAR